MNDLGRNKLSHHLLRRTVHSMMVELHGWNAEADKLSLTERRQLEAWEKELYSNLEGFLSLAGLERA